MLVESSRHASHNSIDLINNGRGGRRGTRRPLQYPPWHNWHRGIVVLAALDKTTSAEQPREVREFNAISSNSPLNTRS